MGTARDAAEAVLISCCEVGPNICVDAAELSTGHFSWTRLDPTRRNVDPTRLAIADKKSDPTRPPPSPICFVS